MEPTEVYGRTVYQFLNRMGVPFSYEERDIGSDNVVGSTIIRRPCFNAFGITFVVIEPYEFETKQVNGIALSAALDTFRMNGIIVVCDSRTKDFFGKPNSTSSNGLRYQNKCPNPLIGIDVELFFYEPRFPYRDDRPACFYDVRVDGQLSSYAAFHDPLIRMSMIVNRVQYSGGFIDGKQVLNALNITRTCKQPSWFSKSFAKDIINKYCTSDTIVDSFAGWGTRYDAAKSLGKKYIGVDLNKDLVKWHNEHGRDIALEDARYFKYDGDCSIFICPPYSDPKTGKCFEDYAFDGFDASAKKMTQCGWLRVVMKNCPNFEEAVMVCKVVDPGWEKFVVEEKKNKSHFGVNSEYVLVVKRGDSYC